MQYRMSDYSLIIQNSNRLYLINTYTGAVGEIDQQLKDIFDYNNYDKMDENTLKVLLENGFIVPSKMNEYNRILELETKAIYSSSNTSFYTIATSLNCNYSCDYCFEPIKRNNDIPANMDRETQEKIVNFIKKHTEKTCEKIIVTWFGGEPLLNIDAIEYISLQLIDYCDKKGIDYFSDIITNGFLLTENNAIRLKQICNLQAAQITIDGPKEIYENIKHTAKDAYEKVINNIKEISRYINVDIRLNIPEYYYPHLEDYIDQLVSEIGNNNINLYLAEVCDDWSDYCGKKSYNSSTFWETNVRFKKLLKDKYPNLIHDSKIPLAFCGMKCGMIKKHNLTIGPCGEFYRCVHMVGREDEVIGSCDDGFYYNEADSKFSGINHPEECKKCIVFPICMTGCPNDILENKIRVECGLKQKTIIDELIQHATKES